MSLLSIKNAISNKLSQQNSPPPSSSSDHLLPTTERESYTPEHYYSFNGNSKGNNNNNNNANNNYNNSSANSSQAMIKQAATTTSSSSSSSSNTSRSDTHSDGFIPPRVMSDAIIGLSDGLTVPFALTAGLSGLGDAKLVITGGLAELVSGAISMGIGGYLAAKNEKEYFYTQLNKEQNRVKQYHRHHYGDDDTSVVEHEVREVLRNSFNLSTETIDLFIKDLDESYDDDDDNNSKLVDFILQYKHRLHKPPDNRQFTSAMTIGGGYFFGGFIPLIPYFFTQTVQTGLWISCLVMVITLFTFGATKTVFSLGSEAHKGTIIKNGFLMLLTGGLAASAAWGMVKFINESG